MRFYYIKYYVEERVKTDENVEEVIDKVVKKAQKMGMKAEWTIEGEESVRSWGSDLSSFATKLGKIGGKKTLDKFGNEHFKAISQKGVEARWGKK